MDEPLDFGGSILTALILIADLANLIVGRRTNIPHRCVALVAGGTILGFDDHVHLDLERSHTVLTPDEARRVAVELKKIADVIDPL
jgi:hypothetical protein